MSSLILRRSYKVSRNQVFQLNIHNYKNRDLQWSDRNLLSVKKIAMSFKMNISTKPKKKLPYTKNKEKTIREQKGFKAVTFVIINNDIFNPRRVWDKCKWCFK